MFWILPVLAALAFRPVALADGGHDHQAVPTRKNQTPPSVTIIDNTVTLTFGPITLPTSHDRELAASMPKHHFQLLKICT